MSFSVFLLIGIIFSKNQPSGLYGLLKFFEFFFFGFYVSRKLKTVKDFEILSILLSFGVIFESMLAVLQFINQKSLGGILYFFGERNFNGQTPGIANASINGKLILRPYGTFSHPNVLGGFLIIASAIIISNLKSQISNLKKMFFAITLIIGTIALFLSMSRVAIVVWLAIILFSGFIYLKNKTKNKFTIYYLMLVVITLAALLLSPIGNRFIGLNLNDESVILREQLIDTSFLMIKTSPVLGVGSNNFLVNVAFYQKTFGNIFYIQPVHNIFLLILSEMGFVGFGIFTWFIYKTCYKLKAQKSKLKTLFFILILIVIFIGFFDHYLLTLQQGQMLLSLVFGMAWSKLNKI